MHVNDTEMHLVDLSRLWCCLLIVSHTSYCISIQHSRCLRYDYPADFSNTKYLINGSELIMQSLDQIGKQEYSRSPVTGFLLAPKGGYAA